MVSSSEDAIISEGLDGAIESWNPGAQRLFGYPADEMLGQRATRLMPRNWQDEKRRVEWGEAVTRFETVRCRKNGSLVDVALAICAITEADGRIVGFISIFRDMAGRTAGRYAD